MACIPPNPRRVRYKDPIHGPLDGPLYTWAQYTPTPPLQSELPAQRCSRLDNKKADTPPQSELPTQQCSSLDKKRVQIEYKGQIPPAATTSHRLR